jgi:hypothetical protein
MWLYVIVIAVIIGAVIGYFGGDGNTDDAFEGAMAGGCMAGSCLLRIAIAALGIIFIIWLFGVLFG